MREETDNAVREAEVAKQSSEEARKIAIRELRQEQRIIARKIRELQRKK